MDSVEAVNSCDGREKKDIFCLHPFSFLSSFFCRSLFFILLRPLSIAVLPCLSLALPAAVLMLMLVLIIMLMSLLIIMLMSLYLPITLVERASSFLVPSSLHVFNISVYISNLHQILVNLILFIIYFLLPTLAPSLFHFPFPFLPLDYYFHYSSCLSSVSFIRIFHDWRDSADVVHKLKLQQKICILPEGSSRAWQ